MPMLFKQNLLHLIANFINLCADETTRSSRCTDLTDLRFFPSATVFS